MVETIELGRKPVIVYCIDQATKKVFKSEVGGVEVSSTGYWMVRVINEKDEKKLLEFKLVYNTKKEADEYIKEKEYIIKYADKAMKDTIKLVDEARVSILGEPTALELAERLMGGKI